MVKKKAKKKTPKVKINRVEPLDLEFRVVALSKGHSTLVDEEDYYWMQDHSWFAVHAPTSGRYYARACIKNKRLQLSRLIMKKMKGRSLSRLEFVDHINRNTLDNRRENLRILTPAQSLFNRSSWGKSEYYGVQVRPQTLSGQDRFMTRLQYKGKLHYGGLFKTAKEAYQRYLELKLEIVGNV